MNAKKQETYPQTQALLRRIEARSSGKSNIESSTQRGSNKDSTKPQDQRSDRQRDRKDGAVHQSKSSSDSDPSRQLVSSIPRRVGAPKSPNNSRNINNRSRPSSNVVITHLYPGKLVSVDNQVYNRIRGSRKVGSVQKDSTLLHQHYATHLGMSVPLASGAGHVPAIATESMKGGNMRAKVLGVQYGWPIEADVAGHSAGVRIFAFPVLPKSNSNTALYLNAMEFELALLKSLTVQYIPSCPATAQGSFVTFFVPNGDYIPDRIESGTGALSEAYESLNYVDSMGWEGYTWQVGLPSDLKPIYNDFSTQDPGDTCVGYLICMTSSAIGGGSSAPQGHFLVEQEWEFINRQLTLPLDSVSTYTRFTVNFSATTQFAGSQAVEFASGSNGVTVVTDNYPTIDATTSALFYGVVITSTQVDPFPLVSSLDSPQFAGISLGTAGVPVWIHSYMDVADGHIYHEMYGSRRSALDDVIDNVDTGVVQRGMLLFDQDYALGSLDCSITFQGYVYKL